MKYCFGVDLGGTAIKIGLFEECGTLLSKWQIPTRTENQGEAILFDISKAIFNKMNEDDIASEDIIGIGIGVPAAVCDDGIIENATNLGWGYKEVKLELEQLTGFSVCVENDANLAALGEWWRGAGKEYKNFVMVTLGTGVGGGIIIDGHIVSGVKGGAGEIGEICVDHELQEDGTVIPRNLEYYASATGVKRIAEQQLAKDTEKTVLGMDNISAKDVFDAARTGDAVAIKVLDKFAFYLGKTLNNLAMILAPEAFVIGGGVSGAGEILLTYVRQYYHVTNTNLILAALGNDAGIYGAQRLVIGKDGEKYVSISNWSNC